MEFDFTEVPSEMIHSVLLETIENQLKSKPIHVELSSATKAGDHNFTGIIFRVSFKTEKETEDEHKIGSSLILKTAPQNIARRTQFSCRSAFTREIFTYDQIFPAFQQFELSKGVDIEKDGFIQYAKCFRTIDEEPHECLILEDLCSRGFYTIDRRTSTVTVDHVELVMQGLAKLHAISFALKDQHPERFNELTSNLSEVFIMRSNQPLRWCLNNQAKLVLNALDPIKDAHFLIKVTEFYKKEAVDTAADCIDLESTGSASVITYGDVWQNNIMFKYNSSGKPTDVVFLDWQAVRQASPVIDIAFFIFCCTTKELRDIHYNNLLKIYYKCLSAHINRLGSNPEKLFPYELMLTHLQKFAKYGLILATVILPVITSESEYRLDIDDIAKRVENGTIEKDNQLITEKSLTNLNQRLRDIVYDMVRLKYI